MSVKHAIALIRLFQPHRQVKKWLIRIAIALLTVFFSTSISLADLSNIRISNSQPLLQQGREFFQAEQFSQATEVWQQAIAAFKASGEPLGEAQAWSYLSLAYQQLGKWQAAETAISSSLSLIRNLEKSRDSELILAQALNTQGHLQLALGQSEQALTTWQKATAAYERAGDTEGLIGSQINQSQALQNLGFYRQARKILEEVEVALQNQPNSLIKTLGLRSLGNTLRAIGELEKSRELLQQSLNIAQELSSPPAISAAQFSLGNTARDLAKKAAYLQETPTQNAEILTALKAYQKAVELSTSPKMRVEAQLNYLGLLIETQNFEEGKILASQIQSQIDELPASRRSVYARINLAQNLLQLKIGKPNPSLITNDQKPAQLLTTAIQQAKSIHDDRAESYALGNLGALYEQTKQSQESLNLTQQALVLAQSINASDIAYRWQWQLGRLLKDQGDKKSAIAAYTIAIETLQSLRNDLVAINLNNPDVQFSFQESVEPVYRELVDLLITTETSQDNLRQARQVIESLRLAELDNFFQEACLDAKPVQIDQIDRNAAVLYPIILPDKLAVILALPQSPLRLYTTLKSQQEVESILDELQQDIGRPAANNEQVLQFSQQVYDWLIRPAEVELNRNNIQTLVFVLDGLLRNIPMAALHDGQRYLIEKYSIALTPGLQLLASQPLKREQLRMLAVGLSEARQGFSPLPNVERELAQIQSQLPNSRELLNQQFTNKNLQQAINEVPFPVVHIATHGQFSSQAEKTFILTWDNAINVKELDILLHQKERELSYPIELLVFSACETAEGDNRAALGLAGIAVRAGARSTMATLWRVSDQSTADLMVQFYQELVKSGVTKAEALRRAQLSLLQERQYRIPYFWAPYVLVGNWR